MTDAHSPPPQSGSTRRPRAWWQWVLGVGLLATAVGMLSVRLFPRLVQVPISELGGIERREITAPAGFKEVDRVPVEPGSMADHNVLIVTFDTTRADRIGCYGNPGIRTPNIDRLAREGVMFTNASATAPVTLPTHSSMMTGLYPFRHGARANGFFTLGDENVTLAEALSQAGYRTGAAVSAFVLESRYGINQGFFDYYDNLDDDPDAWPSVPDRAAGETTDEALRWLGEHAESKFFYWVHYYDPHQPYEAPAEFAQPSKLAYDAEIAYADSQLGRLLELLEQRGILNKTLVIVAGDHGEGLYNHNEATHGFLLYQTTIHVPLVMRCGDKLSGGLYVSRPVSQVDIMPTVLSLLGVPCPERVDGSDLTRSVDPSRGLIFETLEGLVDHGCAPLIGVRQGSRKYVYYGPEPELYDVSQDPFEKKNLAASQAGEEQKLRALLTRYFGEDLEAALRPEEARMPTPEEMQQLAALGYAQGVELDQRPISELTNPKDIGELASKMHNIRDKGVKESIDELEKLAREHPASQMVHMYRLRAYTELEEWDKAEAAAEKLVELKPNHAPTLMNLARLKARRRDFKGAMELLDIAEKQASHQYEVHKQYGQMLYGLKRYSEATDHLIKSFQLDPTDENLPDMIVQAALPVNRLHDAEPVLREALAKRPNLPMTRSALAQILVAREAFAEGIALLREGRALQPDHDGLANNLAYLLATCPDKSLNQPLEASVIIEHVCYRTGFKNPQFLHTLSLVYFTQHRVDEAIQTANRALGLASESEDALIKSLVGSIQQSLAAYEKAKADGMTPMHMQPVPPGHAAGAEKESSGT